MAYQSWDLAALSKGRFILGLGTQVKGHIERRYGFKWEPPVPKLREYVQALRTIFKCWQEGGKKLSFTGKYYNLSLMTPFFAPKPHNYYDSDLYRGRQRDDPADGGRALRRPARASVHLGQISARVPAAAR